MKKLFCMILLGIALTSAAWSVSIFDKLMLPEYTGKLIEGTYKIIDSSDDVMIIEFNGVTYIVRLK